MSSRRVRGPIVIPNCLQLRLHWTSGGRQILNVIHGALTAAGPLNPNLADTYFSSFKTNLTSSGWLTYIGPNVSFTGMSVKDLRAPNNPELFSLTTNLPLAGTGAGTQISNGTALVVTERTAQSGRSFRGRIYMGGLVDAALTSPTQSSTAAETAALAFWNANMTTLNTGTNPLVIGQQALAAGTDKHGNALPPRPANTVPVVAVAIVNHRLDTQRRRLGR